jgi:hypothetical protein
LSFLDHRRTNHHSLFDLAGYTRKFFVSAFTLDTGNVEALRRLIAAGKDIPSLRQAEAITFAGAMEFLMSAVSGDGTRLFKCLEDEASREHPVWKPMLEEWRRETPGDLEFDIHGTRRLEFYRLRTREDQTGLQFSLFQERFKRSMLRSGIPDNFAWALVKVLSEMTDNVIQHSGTSDGSFSGFVGYYVENLSVTFAVADLGCGVLARLKNSEAWKHLSSSRQALRAVVTQGASCRTGQGRGEGFHELFRALVDRNAIVRLRSGDSSLTMSDGITERRGTEVTSQFLPGLQISLGCFLRQTAREIPIFLD